MNCKVKSLKEFDIKNKIMETLLKVKLWDKDVAVVNWDADREIATIEFYESFSNFGLDIAPLMMPLSDVRRGERKFSFPAHRGKTFKGLPGLLADSLPDDYGNSVIDEWFAAKQMQVSITPLDRLSYIGTRGMGALEYEPATDVPGLNESAYVEIAQLTELAKTVLEQRANFSADLTQNVNTIIDILRVGTSAGGAKPKAIIAFNEATRYAPVR